MAARILGLKELQAKLRRAQTKLKQEVPKKISEVARFGEELAKLKAPEYTGDLVSQIIHFQQKQEIWVIQSSPGKHDNVPVNVWFESGQYPNPRDAQTLRFFSKTATDLENKFKGEMKLKNIEK